jgi:hypothetical protein
MGSVGSIDTLKHVWDQSCRRTNFQCSAKCWIGRPSRCKSKHRRRGVITELQSQAPNRIICPQGTGSWTELFIHNFCRRRPGLDLRSCSLRFTFMVYIPYPCLFNTYFYCRVYVLIPSFHALFFSFSSQSFFVLPSFLYYLYFFLCLFFITIFLTVSLLSTALFLPFLSLFLHLVPFLRFSSVFFFCATSLRCILLYTASYFICVTFHMYANHRGEYCTMYVIYLKLGDVLLVMLLGLAYCRHMLHVFCFYEETNWSQRGWSMSPITLMLCK